MLAVCFSSAKRSNPGAASRGPWVASSQELLAMTGGAPLVQIDSAIIGRRLGAAVQDLGAQIGPPMMVHRATNTDRASSGSRSEGFEDNLFAFSSFDAL